VGKLESTLKKCNINPAEFGWGKGVFNFWRKPSVEKVAENAVASIKESSLFGHVNTKLVLIESEFKKVGLTIYKDAPEIKKAKMFKAAKRRYNSLGRY